MNDCRVALFSQDHLGQWYPQPYVMHQTVEIGPGGLVQEEVHLGRRYAALVVRAKGYTEQDATLFALPVRYALARDDAEAGARRADDEPQPTAGPATTAHTDIAQDISDSPRVPAGGESLTQQPAAVPSVVSGWLPFFSVGSAVLTLLGAVLLLSLLLHLSGRFKAFAEALEHFLRELIRTPAFRMHQWRAGIRAQLKKESLVLITTAFCLTVALGAAVANYYVLRFSFELLLPVGDTLSAVAVVFVLLKGAAGVLLHHLNGYKRALTLAGLILASGLGCAFAYERARAVQEFADYAATSSTAAGATAGVVKVNEGVLGGLNAAGDATQQVGTTGADPRPSGDGCFRSSRWARCWSRPSHS